MGNGLTCEISNKISDPEWDAFVASVPRGDHWQSSHWAAFKASFGWSPTRIVIRKGIHIVAGSQVLMRRVLSAVKIAYVVQGPVLLNNEPEPFEMVIDQLVRLIRAARISYLAMLPAYNCRKVDILRKYGFQASRLLGEQRATLIIDLTQDLSILLRQMRRTTRNNIILAHDQGVRIREGTDADLAVFHQLLGSTYRRHGSRPESQEYCQSLWKHLRPSGHLRVFLAEDGGEALSGLLAVPFGDTVVMKRFGWSGGKRQLRPNDLLIWRAIEWSKENGFHNFDLDGIHISAARALLAGQSLPESEKSTTTRFKLGFGGSIVLLPAGYEYISNDILRMVFSRFVMMLGRDNLTQMIRRIPPARIVRKAV